MAKIGEYGRIGQRRYSGVFFEEFLPELRGAKGAEAYTEMADNDSTIGAILFAIENLMRNCEFTIEPGGNNAKDEEAAEFVDGCLHDMCNTWTDTLSEMLSFITYGWSYHEIVYKRRMGKKTNSADSSKYDDGLIGWKKLPIRSQETLYEWVYKDHTDDLSGMHQMTVTDTDVVDVVIPIEKALHFITRSRKSNPEGRSILRTAYRDWYFKKRIMEIEGIGIERDLAGFPTLSAPEGLDLWDSDDPEMVAALSRAEAIITGIRRDSREGLVMPFGWELNLLSTGSRRQFDTNQIIERYNKQIATSVLTDFVLLGHESVGSFALADNKTKMFSLAVGTYLDIICEVFNNQAIPRLIDINGDHFKGITDYPRMKHGDIEDANLEKIGNFIQQMVGVGALTPDDDLEDYLRKISNLPESKVSIPYEERMGEQTQDPEQQQNPDEMTEEGQIVDGAGGKTKTATMYEIKSIMTDYLRGNMPKNMAENMLRRIGINDNDIASYISEYDNLRTENERKKMAEKQVKEQSKPTPSEESRKEKAKEEKAEKDPDELQDEKEAEEARKSLGRGEEMPTFNELFYGTGKVRKSLTFSEILKGNPYHDRLGRFTSAGAAASFTYTPGNSAKIDQFIAQETAKAGTLAAQRVSNAQEQEPKITALMSSCAKSAGGEMVGLQYAVKSESSLTRKITTEIKEKGITAEEAAASMKDVNRYTMQLKERNFVSGYEGTMKSLQNNGYEVVRVKNTLAKKDAEYRGINCNIKSPDGSIWELQFHTAKSLEIKEINHKLYEEQRLDTTPKAQKKALGEEMIRNAKSIPTPKNIGNIANVNKL